jgi:hypothetical protein
MIQHLSELPGHVVGLICTGRIAQVDYETVMLPAIEAALQRHEKVRLYYQIAQDFSHIEPGVSHDFDLGIDYLMRWERIAIVTNLDWFRETVRALSFLLPGHVELFLVNEAAKARAWILA